MNKKVIVVIIASLLVIQLAEAKKHKSGHARKHKREEIMKMEEGLMEPMIPVELPAMKNAQTMVSQESLEQPQPIMLAKSDETAKKFKRLVKSAQDVQINDVKVEEEQARVEQRQEQQIQQELPMNQFTPIVEHIIGVVRKFDSFLSQFLENLKEEDRMSQNAPVTI